MLFRQLLLRRALRPRRAVVQLHRVPHRLLDAEPQVPHTVSTRGLIAHLIAGKEHAEEPVWLLVDVRQSFDRDAVGLLAVVRDWRAGVDARSFAEARWAPGGDVGGVGRRFVLRRTIRLVVLRCQIDKLRR